MIINKIVLNNFGVFKGQHELLLYPDHQFKPIIIIGGMNGAGKTTVFNAIKLCLYGSHIFKNNNDYSKYIKDKIHRSKEEQCKDAFLTVEFKHSMNGQISIYCVTRNWITKQEIVKESLSILKNGKKIDEVEKENWQEFIKELIPIGLSRLFFFDGEKIQKMMSDDNSELKDSMKSILGLDLIERLNADLRIYKNKNLHEKRLSDDTKELDKLLIAKNEIKTTIKKIKDKKAKLNNNILLTMSKIEDYKKKIAAQGGWYLENRDQLQHKKISLEHEIERIKTEIREICAGLLPVTILSNLSDKLKHRIIKEEKIKKQKLASSILLEKANKIKKTINSKKFFNHIPELNKKTIIKIQNLMKSEIENQMMNNQTKLDDNIIFDLSQKQTSEVLNGIEEATTSIPIQLKNLVKQYETTYRELQNIEVSIDRAPDEDDVKPMHETLQSLVKKLGALENENKHYDEDIKNCNYKSTEIDRQINKINHQKKEMLKNNVKLELVTKTEQILPLFYSELSTLKSQTIMNHFNDIFSQLNCKNDLLSKIDIHPESFDTTLYDKDYSNIDKTSLSSGELEIFAISMVWALAKTSGRNLPFIIDTPLGRLDSKHRNNLLNIFFPNASHQMIIFSTDTEIDKQNYQVLKPHVSKTYLLAYNDNEKQGSIKKGYFNQ